MAKCRIYQIALGVFSLVTTAHAVPEGCFVPDGSSYCYGGSFSASDCDQYNMTAYGFGVYMSSACSYINTAEALLGLCSNDLTTCSNNLNTCTSAFNAAIDQRDSCLADKTSCVAAAASIEVNRQQWIAYSNARNALIKKLYRVCGKKCKKIKAASMELPSNQN